MLPVKTKLDLSGIHGIGLFADEFIPKGAILWKFNSLFDLRCSEEDIERLSESSREQIQKYSYREKQPGLYVLCGDDARFSIVRSRQTALTITIPKNRTSPSPPATSKRTKN